MPLPWPPFRRARTTPGYVHTRGLPAALACAIVCGVGLASTADALKLGSGAQEPRTCDGTTSYVFIVSDHLPLEVVWRAYFDGCPPGSYTIQVHSQDMRPLSLLTEATLVPDPVQGNPRFKYKMQEIMLKLYRQAANSLTDSGCKPQWVQLLSESCAPVRRCVEHHDLLTTYAGTSLIGDGSHNLFETPPGKSRKPALWHEMFWLKQTQWNTLWMEHAEILLQKEEENVALWNETWCPDEHYTVNILRANGANISRRTLTKVLYTQDIISDFISGGHPELVKCLPPGTVQAAEAEEEDTAAAALGASALGIYQSARVRLPQFMSTGERQVSICEDAECRRTHARSLQHIVNEVFKEGASFVRKFETSCADMLLELQTRRAAAAEFAVEDRTVDLLHESGGEFGTYTARPFFDDQTTNLMLSTLTMP